MLLTLQNTSEQFGAMLVIGGEVLPDEWKEEHDDRLQELVRLLGQRCKRT